MTQPTHRMRFFSMVLIAIRFGPASLTQGLAVLMLLAVLLPSHALAARVALVIGNAAYAEGPLRNPVNDARAMDQKLTSLGFKVQRIENMKRQQIGRTLSGLVGTIKAGDEVVVFYAGHGLQVKGVNYLPVVDADIQSEDDVPLNSLNLNALMDRLDEAKAGLKLLFLDACRNNPYARSFRGGDRGLARMGAAPSGTLIHFATRPGSVAADGTGANGLYTTQLLRHMDMPNVPVETMLKRVSVAVEAESKGTQEPWTEGSIRGDFYFKAGPGVQLASVQAEPIADAQSPRNPETDAWDAAQRANTSGGYTAYLSEYPSGRFAAAARVARAGIAPTASGATPAPAAVPPAKSGDAETQLWNEVKARGTRDYLDAYFKQYPKGKYLALAKLEVQKLDDGDKAERARVEAEQLKQQQLAREGERKEAQRLEDEQWQKTLAKTSRTALQAYIAKYPNSRYVAEAQRKDEEYRLKPPRPVLPFALDESVWRALESSEAYRNAPSQRPVQIQAEWTSESEVIGKSDLKSKTKRSSTTKVVPLTDKCSVKKSIEKTDYGMQLAQSEYTCGGIIVGSILNGEVSQYSVGIETSGSLNPPHIGAAVSYGATVRVPIIHKDVSQKMVTCKTTDRREAQQLNSKLQGAAWVVHCRGSGIGGEEWEDYLLEELGLMASSIGVMDNSGGRAYAYVIPLRNTKYILSFSGGIFGDDSRTVNTYNKYEISFNEDDDGELSVATDGARIPQRGRIGVQLEKLDAQTGQMKGALVSSVTAGLPAQIAGIEARDVITKIDGASVESVDDVIIKIGGTKPGTRITLTVLRRGSYLDLAVVVAAAPASLSEILCVRHNMSPRSMNAEQDEQGQSCTGAANHTQRTH